MVEQATDHVLVVDDHELVRGLLVDVLESAGMHVIPADSGMAAIQILKERGGEIACVVQDMSMPGMSGPETIRNTLELMPDARIIVLSVDDEASVRSQLGDLPIRAYLEKPCDTDRLIELVRDNIATD